VSFVVKHHPVINASTAAASSLKLLTFNTSLHSGAYLCISLSPCHKCGGSGFSQMNNLRGIIIVSRMKFIESIPQEELTRFCQRWQIREFALFGSALRADFKPESDVDVLVSFNEKANWGLFDHVQMRNDLEAIFKRKVDLVTRRALEQTQNQLLRDRILKTARVVFVD
jgi:uncharacterized protein